MMIARDFSHRSARQDWHPPHLFSHVEHFEFTNRHELLEVCSLPIGPQGFRVVELRSSGHESIVTEFIKTAVVFPISGIFDCNVGCKKITATRGDVALFGPIRRKTTVTPDSTGEYRSFSIISPEDSNKLCGGAYEHEGIAEGGWRLHRKSSKSSSIISFIEHAFNDLSSTTPLLLLDRALASAEALIGEYYVQLIRDQASDPTENAACFSKLMSGAREFMAAHYSEPIAIPDIAMACNVSVRTLQAAFRADLGMSPRQALTAIRLEKARFALERAVRGTSVTSAALDAGFCHFGRFSHLYVLTFGEKPSETLSRARRSHHLFTTGK